MYVGSIGGEGETQVERRVMERVERKRMSEGKLAKKI